MNRYVMTGLLADAREGKDVILVSATWNAARAAFDQATDAVLGEAVEVRRTHGRELVRYRDSGGSLRFVSAGGSSVRGFSADVVFVDCDAGQAVMAQVVPVVHSRNGELLRR